MDNLTHSLCGWILARVGFEHYGRAATPILILAANFPDLEPVLLPGSSRAEYLLYHRGVTHSVLVLAVNSILFGVVLWMLERLAHRHKRRETPPAVLPAIGICAAGLFSHLALDYLNSYGVRPWLPFNGTWYYGDMSFIVDPWIWLLLAVPVLWGTTFNRTMLFVWAVVLAVMGGVMLYGSKQFALPIAVPVLWCAIALAAIALRVVQRPAMQSVRIARAGLLFFGLYVCLLFAASRTAHTRALDALTQAEPTLKRDALKSSTLPLPGQPWCFDVIAQDGEQLYAVRVNIFVSPLIDQERMTLKLNDQALATVRGTFEYVAWRSFARHPRVERRGDVLILGDARYQTFGRGDWTAQHMVVPED